MKKFALIFFLVLGLAFACYTDYSSDGVPQCIYEKDGQIVTINNAICDKKVNQCTFIDSNIKYLKDKIKLFVYTPTVGQLYAKIDGKKYICSDNEGSVCYCDINSKICRIVVNKGVKIIELYKNDEPFYKMFRLSSDINSNLTIEEHIKDNNKEISIKNDDNEDVLVYLETDKNVKLKNVAYKINGDKKISIAPIGVKKRFNIIVPVTEDVEFKANPYDIKNIDLIIEPMKNIPNAYVVAIKLLNTDDVFNCENIEYICGNLDKNTSNNVILCNKSNFKVICYVGTEKIIKEYSSESPFSFIFDQYYYLIFVFLVALVFFVFLLRISPDVFRENQDD